MDKIYSKIINIFNYHHHNNIVNIEKSNNNIPNNNIIIDKNNKKKNKDSPNNNNNKKKNKDSPNNNKKKKSPIPKAVKVAVWNTYVGQDKGQTKCFAGCGTIITSLNFSAGHIQSEYEGGEINVENLRPICVSCNSSMGTQNMKDFAIKYGLKHRLDENQHHSIFSYKRYLG